jgi:hypothetical protein
VAVYKHLEYPEHPKAYFFESIPALYKPSTENYNEVISTLQPIRETLLTEYPIIDAEDESLQRYKESLGLGGGGKDLSDPNDPRDCIILSLEMNSEGRPPVKLDVTAPGALETLKDHPFKLKEGCRFNLTATFKVQHNVLSGLQYLQVVKRKGIAIAKIQEMIVGASASSTYHKSLTLQQGSYAPNTDKNPQYKKTCMSMPLTFYFYQRY